MRKPATSARSARTVAAKPRGPRRAATVVDLRRYAPAYFTWIANKLSSGASQAYLTALGVGIETWRVLVLLAIEPSASAQRICKEIGMDKASVSRTLNGMLASGLITIGLDAQDGRLRIASITPAGRALHDEICGIAFDRERALLAVLTADEREVLLGLLHRLHDNLPAVDASTARYLALHYPDSVRRRSGA